jgi:hypothetical protein
VPLHPHPIALHGSPTSSADAVQFDSDDGRAARLRLDVGQAEPLAAEVPSSTSNDE